MDEKSFEEVTKELVTNLENAVKRRAELLSDYTVEEQEIINKECEKMIENMWGTR